MAPGSKSEIYIYRIIICILNSENKKTKQQQQKKTNNKKKLFSHKLHFKQLKMRVIICRESKGVAAEEQGAT